MNAPPNRKPQRPGQTNDTSPAAGLVLPDRPKLASKFEYFGQAIEPNKWLGVKPPFKVKAARATENRLPLMRGTIIGLLKWSPLQQMPGWEHRPGQLAVWCPHCSRFHLHGWPTYLDGRHASHRIDHCSNSKNFPDGYWISTFRLNDYGYCGHVIKPGTIRARRACR